MLSGQPRGTALTLIPRARSFPAHCRNDSAPYRIQLVLLQSPTPLHPASTHGHTGPQLPGTEHRLFWAFQSTQLVDLLKPSWELEPQTGANRRIPWMGPQGQLNIECPEHPLPTLETYLQRDGHSPMIGSQAWNLQPGPKCPLDTGKCFCSY